MRDYCAVSVSLEEGDKIGFGHKESPVGESQSNGDAENAVKQIQGHARVLRDNLEARYQQKIGDEHPCLPWLIMHAAWVKNCNQVGSDNKTAFLRHKRKSWPGKWVEFEECVWYLKPQSEGMYKFDYRWEIGVRLGVRKESGEVYIRTRDGVLKIRTVRRKGSLESRWDWQFMVSMQGIPWEPIAGQGQREVKAHVNIPRTTEGVPARMEKPETKEVVVKRPPINAEDLVVHGYTVGCSGCAAAQRGERGNHNKICVRRFEQIWQEQGDERHEQLIEKIIHHGPDRWEEAPTTNAETRVWDEEATTRGQQDENNREELSRNRDEHMSLGADLSPGGDATPSMMKQDPEPVVPVPAEGGSSSSGYWEQTMPMSDGEGKRNRGFDRQKEDSGRLERKKEACY